jgi:hypothetical protein
LARPDDMMAQIPFEQEVRWPFHPSTDPIRKPRVFTCSKIQWVFAPFGSGLRDLVHDAGGGIAE